MDPVDPKRRGRRLFGARRRHEHPAEADMNDQTATVDPQSSAAGEPSASTRPGAEPDDGPKVSDPVGTLTEPDAEPERPGSADANPAIEPESGAPISVEDDEPEVLDEAATDAAPPAAEPASEESDATHEPASVTPGPEATGPSTSTPAAAPRTPAEAVAGTGGWAAAEEAAEPGEPDGSEAEDDAVVGYELPRIIAIANQKGGVGKTTTSVNLGAALAEMGYRVLVVDLDPQGNATTGLGVNARELQGSIYDVIMNDTPVEDCVEPTSLKNLFVAPATIDLAGAEIELVPAFSRELKLRRALHELRDEYDYMLIDCPPSLGLLTVNGLAAANDVIVPIQCEYYALEGLSQLTRNVSLVQKNLNPSLDIRGIVLTMYDARTKLADQVEQEVREHFGRTVYQTVVPRTVRLAEAPSFGQPIILFDPTSRGAVAYRELAKEVSSGATRRTG
jgi:chromosome partitioning protein